MNASSVLRKANVCSRIFAASAFSASSYRYACPGLLHGLLPGPLRFRFVSMAPRRFFSPVRSLGRLYLVVSLL